MTSYQINRFIQRKPHDFIVANPLTRTVLDLSLAALEVVDSRDAIESVTKFLNEFLLSISVDVHEIKRDFLDNFAAKMTSALLTACLIRLPSYFIPEFAEVIHALINLDFDVISLIIQGFFMQTNILQPKKLTSSSSSSSSSSEEELKSASEDLLKSKKNPKSVAASLRVIHRLLADSRL